MRGTPHTPRPLPTRGTCTHSSVHLALDNRVFYREAQSLRQAGYHVTLIAVHEQDEVRAGVILTQKTCLNHCYSLPNKLLDYLQAGIPVLGCGLPEIAQVIREYQVGETAEPLHQNRLPIELTDSSLIQNTINYWHRTREELPLALTGRLSLRTF